MKQYYVAAMHNGNLLTPTYGFTYAHIAYPNIDRVNKHVKEHTHVSDNEYTIMTVSEYREKFDPTAEFIGADTSLDV